VEKWDDPEGIYMTLQEAKPVVLFCIVSHKLDWYGDAKDHVWRRDWIPEQSEFSLNNTDYSIIFENITRFESFSIM
jgi:hypothetical protein